MSKSNAVRQKSEIIPWVDNLLYQWGAWARSDQTYKSLEVGSWLGGIVKRANADNRIWDEQAPLVVDSWESSEEMENLDTQVITKLDDTCKRLIMLKYRNLSEDEILRRTFRVDQRGLIAIIGRIHKEIERTYAST